MYEQGAVWTIVGPDGTTLVMNDGLSGLLLESVTGFDSPNVRQNISDLPEADGAVAGNSYFSNRPVVLSGKIAASSASQRNTTAVNMQRATRGLRGDVTLKSQPQGLPAMQATARLTNLRITGGFVKDFQLSLVCADPRMYSQTLNVSSATGVAVTPGASFPWAFPVNWGGGSGATLALNITNAGNFTTPPLIRVSGPVNSPQVKNAATGESIVLGTLVLGSGEYVDLDTNLRTAVKNDGTNVYSQVMFPGSSWFYLGPGSTTVQLFASGATGSTGLQVSWRDAWA